MSMQEAYQVLGVAPGSTREEILEAWRRLIKRVHPDHGGSAFLTTKINMAKSVLLGDE
jgi:curved DNA-binding protein CbpA